MINDEFIMMEFKHFHTVMMNYTFIIFKQKFAEPLLPTRNITCKVNSLPLNFKNTDGSITIKYCEYNVLLIK